MRYRLILKETRGYNDSLDVYNSLPKKQKDYLAPRGRYVDASTILYRYVKKIDGLPVGFIDLYPLDSDPKFSPESMAVIVMGVRKEYQHQGISKLLFGKAVKWAKKHNYNLGGKVDVNNTNSLKAALKYGFKIVDKTKDRYYLVLELNNKENLREDLGNTPKGYKDINKIMDYCNEWFENNPDKADKVIWKRHIQVRNWIRELKKYRSKFGPITFERDLKELKLKDNHKDKDGYTSIETAILHAFDNWKKNRFNPEDRNKELMYCLIELRDYRKKFKKQDFSNKM